MIIFYIDLILLVILLCLMLFTCGYCFIRVYRLQRNNQVTVLLKPRNVVFRHKKEEGGEDELRTVVAYQNPFTGDYCVSKSRVGPKEYFNSMQGPESPDSGMSDEYEPVALPPDPPRPAVEDGHIIDMPKIEEPLDTTKLSELSADHHNSINKTWNWNYTEYQI